MKKQLKKCKGFDKAICRHCKRKDSTATLLVEKLLIDPVTLFNKCEYFVS